MANPTTNYGFVLPTATDLVTDLPADFDVALQGVDTRLKALQPGTTLGDIAYSSATANTNTRLGIGTSGQVLAVSGGVPAWTTPASSSFPTFSAYKSGGTQTFSAATWTKITFATESWDAPGCFASSTFTPTSAGYYSVNSAVYHGQVGNGDFTLAVYKNGSLWQRLYLNNPTSAGVYRVDGGATLVYCNGTTDYIEIYARGDSGGDVSIIEGASLSYFSAIGIRA